MTSAPTRIKARRIAQFHQDLHANWFEIDLAMKSAECSQKAYEHRDFLTPFLAVAQEREFLRSHPRGQAILRKMELRK